MIITQDVGEPRVELDLILVQVLVQLLRAQHLGDPDQLVVVVVPKSCITWNLGPVLYSSFMLHLL